MYVIRWIAKYGLQSYLSSVEDIEGISGGARWGSLKRAKQFDSESKAEAYITSAGRRFWDKYEAVVMLIHPLNLPN